MYTHTHRETSSRAYVCMQVECTRQKSVKCFCCAPCSSSSNSSPAIIVSKYPTASTNRNQSYDSIPQPPLHLLRKPQQWLRFICSAKCKGQSKKQKQKKTLTISCSSKIKCKCKQQLASIVMSKVWEVEHTPSPAFSPVYCWN